MQTQEEQYNEKEKKILELAQNFFEELSLLGVKIHVVPVHTDTRYRVKFFIEDYKTGIIKEQSVFETFTRSYKSHEEFYDKMFKNKDGSFTEPIDKILISNGY
jgi:hypothetical protein